MAYWVYRPEPQPTQGIRYLPASALVTGDQPPRYSPAQYMALVNASWPADKEPRLPAQLSRGPIAPQTLLYGDQPPRFSNSNLYVTRNAWEPPPPLPSLGTKTAAWNIPILTQPQYSIKQMMALVASWEPPPPPPFQLKRNALASLIYGDQPPSYSSVNLYAVLGNWPQDKEPRLPVKIWQGNIAPLTLTYGDQPVPYSRYDLKVIRGAWESSQPPTLNNQNAAWNFTLASSNPPPPSASNLMGIVNSWASPQQPYQLKNSALTALAYGDMPPQQSQFISPYPAPYALPAQQKTLVQPFISVAGDNPPPLNMAWLYGVVTAWQLPFNIVRQMPMQVVDNTPPEDAQVRGKRVYVRRNRKVVDFIKEIFDDLAQERYENIPQVFVDTLEQDVIEKAQPYIASHSVQDIVDNTFEIMALRLKVLEWIEDVEDDEDIILLMNGWF